MKEKFCVDVKVLYVPEMFKRLRVSAFVEREISCGHLINRVGLFVWILSCRITARFTNSPCTLEVEGQDAKPCFAETKQPIEWPILIRRCSSGSSNLQHFPKLSRAQKDACLCAQGTKVRQKVHYLTYPGCAGVG